MHAFHCGYVQYTSVGTCKAQPAPSPTLLWPFLLPLQLLILFGLPTVCIILPWVLSEPEALVLLAPFLLLVPGPRDVLRSVATEAMAGVAKAKSFTPGDQQQQEQQRGSSGYSSSGSGSYDGPPPPPPSRRVSSVTAKLRACA